MKDIVGAEDGNDLSVLDAVVAKAGNVLSMQVNDLEYAPSLGVDLSFFLESDFQFQNESFKAYLVQRLIEHQVNVAKVIDTVNTLYTKYTHFVGDSNEVGGGLIL